MQRKYFIRENGKNIGYTFSELKNKKLNKSTKIWIEGSDKWIRLDMIPELNEISETINENENKNYIYIIIVIILSIILAIFFSVKNFTKENNSINNNVSEKENNIDSTIVESPDMFLDSTARIEDTAFFDNNYYSPIHMNNYVYVLLKTKLKKYSGEEYYTNVSEIQEFNNPSKDELNLFKDRVISHYLNSIDAKVYKGEILEAELFSFNNYSEASNNRNKFLIKNDNYTDYTENTSYQPGFYYVIASANYPVYFHNTPNFNDRRNARFTTIEKIYVEKFSGNFAYVEFTNSENKTSKGWIEIEYLDLIK
ncbi:DUF4339 domain-containing protein [Faecalibacter bovis]|uniref:DUF4339 domain-containing protein n=1 Tax=Faecalibacter bovis TaxID=2898187 RepID=A0ABX7XAD8_9FLAO|nr:DUF4339 domain-containing protein [Faecalibacter bovis]QTV04857.1 DUF4339 domain-containing protein [Faecalibacter bovis]